jgi:hypothetical protein
MHKTTIDIWTSEEVTPEFLALRVAQACAEFYALRPGEYVGLNDKKLYKVVKPENPPIDAIEFFTAKVVPET